MRREPVGLLAIAFLHLALPAALLQAISPPTMPGRLPEPGLWLLLLPVVPVASLLGTLAICRLALCPGEGPRTALREALGRLLPLLRAALPLGLAALLLAGAGLLLVAAFASPLALILPLALGLFFWVRLLLLTPVAAVEPVGPPALIRRAWGLSAGHFWQLLALLLLAAILSLAVLAAAGLVGGIARSLLAGQSRADLLVLLMVLLVSTVLQTLVASLFTVLLARLYARLA